MASRCEAAAARAAERAARLGAPRLAVLTALQYGVLMSDGPALREAAAALAAHDALFAPPQPAAAEPAALAPGLGRLSA